MCFYCKFPVLLNGMWAFTIKLMLLWTMNEGIGFTHLNTGSISFKTWYIYVIKQKTCIWVDCRFSAFVWPLDLLFFHFIKSYRSPILTPHFFHDLLHRGPLWQVLKFQNSTILKNLLYFTTEKKNKICMWTRN